MPPADGSLTLGQALALGVAQGPTELLPISSSAHTSLLADLAGWRYQELDARSRKSFELALHGGAGLALLLAAPPRLPRSEGALRGRRMLALALALGPPALAGAALRSRIERHLGSRRVQAACLLAGALAMALADARSGEGRRCSDVRAIDGLALGLAQALALAPGVSRSGAALTAARARGFGRSDAQSLSLALAMPLLVGASLADAAGLAGAGRGADSGAAPARVAGGAAAFVSTLLSARVLLSASWRERPLLPYAAYRALLAAALLMTRPGGGRSHG
jgi:undecaprenyl-diphosphatase